MAPETPPSDLDRVRQSFRLGWAVAELRGRHRPDRFEQPLPVEPQVFHRPSHELPLGTERGSEELRIEVLKTAKGLSTALGLDENESVASALSQVANLAWDRNGKDADIVGGWDGFANAIFTWDARLQDALVVQANQAAAYQLGRGLAETYWELDPNRPANEMGSWTCVLGDQRNHTLQHLALRLSAYVGPSVLAAVTAPLDSWIKLAANKHQRKRAAVQSALYEQGLLWRDLVRGERQPDDLDQPEVKDVWRDLSLYKTAVIGLGWPLTCAALGAAVMIAGAASLASGSVASSWATAISILGALGLTSAGLYARAKANLMSMVAKIRQAVQLEQVRRAANLASPLLQNEGTPQARSRSTSGRRDPPRSSRDQEQGPESVA